jgi:hypothetical protein
LRPAFLFSLAEIHARGQTARGAKNALQAAFFFLGVFSYIPHGETRQKGRKIERQRQPHTQRATQHAPRGENNAIGAHETPRPTNNTTHGANAPKTPEKGQHGKSPRRQERPRARASRIAGGRQERGADHLRRKGEQKPNRKTRTRKGKLQGSCSIEKRPTDFPQGVICRIKL